MAAPLSREEILAYAHGVADAQLGGTLATTHAEDGTPYVTFVLFHLRDDGKVLFGSGAGPQHTRNMSATPEVSFLVDNREAIKIDWTAFDRVVIEGSAARIDKDDPLYEGYLADLARKNAMAAQFTAQGQLFCITPRRLVLMKGLEPVRHIVDFVPG
jgi:nitroimidazol reductase NimA-like FMN-containing flavoprotein (pyridoxamine 5'-phosphate oxidase superfamily)